ncbi:putative phage tail assembly chaperone [Edwardsiella tarda]|uniref:putative phage tail assembly chaperone n=1 Tax=Edwardsiella tarda TaxID=636 RepID=UPI0034DD842A
MADKVKVVLQVGDDELTFEPNAVAYNKMLNEMTMTNKVAPAVNYLTRIVTADSKAALLSLMASNPSAALQLAEVVNETFAPKLEITVKN